VKVIVAPTTAEPVSVVKVPDNIQNPGLRSRLKVRVVGVGGEDGVVNPEEPELTDKYWI
jgi:hypothetical protein